MSQPQQEQPQQPAQAAQPGAAAGPIDPKDVQWWMDQLNGTLQNVGGAINQQSPAGASSWSNGFFECFNPIDTCLLTWFCPCVTFGRTYHRLHKDAKLEGWQPVNASCLVSMFACCFPIAAQRAVIRAKYNLQGSCLEDLLCGWCCGCCSIIQMDKEVEEKERLMKGDTKPYTPQTEMAYPSK